jgi:hypothetical protein
MEQEFTYEEWRPIKGYEGLYEVSNFGRVKVLDRFVKNRFSKRLIKGYITEGRKKGGCHNVYIVGKEIGIHILVAQAFPEICGEWFEECEVHHIDGNPANNNAKNLVCLTKEEHIRMHNPPKPDKWARWRYNYLR